MEGRAMELEQDLRSASDLMLSTLAELERLENEKRAELPGTKRFQSLATEIERLASTVFAQTHNQKRLADMTVQVTRRASVELTPIDEVSAARDVRVILAEWRAAERKAADAAPESAERSQALADARRLRDEYQRAYQQPDDGTSSGN
jgi:hypothetical protein